MRVHISVDYANTVSVGVVIDAEIVIDCAQTMSVKLLTMQT